MNPLFTPTEDYFFYQLLENPVQNEQQILITLSQRFESLQQKQNITYTLVIGDKGSSPPVEISLDNLLSITIPIFSSLTQQ